ncbi:MAG: peptidylprolyl isomerase [Verrucomicrobiota bacterium]|nr:peptidylprolyl isomerase [Verrucomicrobiota bacterium]
MINVLRKNQKALWIVIGILCIPFVFYFSNSKVGAMGQNQLGTIYNRAVPIAEAQRSARLFNLGRELGMFTFLQDMVAGAQTENDAYAEFTWNRLVLQHEAERLGIQPNSGEVVKLIQGLRPFQGQAGFDPAKYDDFTKNVLPSLGFNESQLEELASDSIMLQRVKDLIATGVQMPEAETKEQYERAYGKLHVSVARLRADEIAKDVNVSDDDVAKYYEARKDSLKSDEKRKVSFVSFALDEEQKKLQGKERFEILQKLADRANDFNQTLADHSADFAQAAAKFQLPIETTGEFARSASDPALKGNQQLATAAFQLSAQNPTSEAVQVGDGFYILHLDGIDAAKPLSLEEARPKIVDSLKKEKKNQLITSKAAEVKQKITAALASGTPVDAALAQAGVPVEKIPPFALTDPATPPPAPPPEPGKEAPPAPPAPPADLQTIKSAVVELNPGEVSDAVPTENGGSLIVVVESREPPPPEMAQLGKQIFESRFLRSRQEIAFYQWLRERRREAGAPMNTPTAAEIGAS